LVHGQQAGVESIWKIFLVYPLDAGTYEDTNKKMFRDYKKTHNPDGEILFLAADPDVKVKGVGTQLLDELARRETGKEIYLFTDSACTRSLKQKEDLPRANDPFGLGFWVIWPRVLSQGKK